MAQDLVAAVQRGREAGAPPPRPRPLLDPERRMDMNAQRRLGLLKEWRNAASQRSGRTTVAILPNYAMFEVAKLRPTTLEKFAENPGVGEKRARMWGPEIIDLMK